MWVDIKKGYIGKWADLFKDLEQNHGLDVDSNNHIWLLHYLYLGSINDDAMKWSATWNQHAMRLPGGKRGGISPLYQFLMGMVENGLRGSEVDDAQYQFEGIEYGIDWNELEDPELVQNLLERRRALHGDAGAPPAAPPHWSRIEVNPPPESPLTDAQLNELDGYVSSRVDITSNRMDERRRFWVYALRYFNQLVIEL